MPTYQYRCRDCHTDLEVVQKFTDASLTECPNCDGGTLRKIFNAVGVVFKGSGFYRTDSRSGTRSPAAAASDASDTSGKSESTSEGGKKSEGGKEPARAGASTGSNSQD